MFVYRTNAERSYHANLNAIGAETISGWRGAEIIYMDAYCVLLSQLVEEFRYLRNTNSYSETFVRNERQFCSRYELGIPYQCVSYLRKTISYWETFVRNERRFRSKNGLVIPYQCVSTFSVRRCHLKRGFASLKAFWSRTEVPRG